MRRSRSKQSTTLGLTYIRTTDRWTDANEETAHLADTPAPAGRSVELDFAELLEDFFRICQGPNKAEVLMLSTVCQESAAWVKQWCR